jgi:transposase
VTEVGCLAHARRKFFDLWSDHKSPVAEEALRVFAAIYDIEQTAQALDVDQRTRLRTLKTQPILETFHTWLTLQRQKATDGIAIARAIDYSLNRWEALVRFVGAGSLPPDNNQIENRIRPIALGRSNWPLADSGITL